MTRSLDQMASISSLVMISHPPSEQDFSWENSILTCLVLLSTEHRSVTIPSTVAEALITSLEALAMITYMEKMAPTTSSEALAKTLSGEAQTVTC